MCKFHKNKISVFFYALEIEQHEKTSYGIRIRNQYTPYNRKAMIPNNKGKTIL